MQARRGQGRGQRPAPCAERRDVGIWRSTLLIISVLLLGLLTGVPDALASCTRAEFEEVVGQAAIALRDLNSKNKPAYQAKLRQLKDKRGWSHEDFVTAAAPLVQDDKIAVFDQTSSELLLRINTMGQDGNPSGPPDCNLLTELRGHMTTLVKTQEDKWQYMFGRIDQELSK